MILNLENFKEGNLLVMSNGWIIQIIRYNKTEIKFRIHYLNTVDIILGRMLSSNPCPLYYMLYRNNTFKVYNQISKFGFLFSNSSPINVRAVITDKKAINRIKALTRKVIPKFHIARRRYNNEKYWFYLDYQLVED